MNKIESSIGHRFYTADGWKKLKDIKTGDYILVRYYNNMANSKRIINPEKWYQALHRRVIHMGQNLKGEDRLIYSSSATDKSRFDQ